MTVGVYIFLTENSSFLFCGGETGKMETVIRMKKNFKQELCVSIFLSRFRIFAEASKQASKSLFI